MKKCVQLTATVTPNGRVIRNGDRGEKAGFGQSNGEMMGLPAVVVRVPETAVRPPKPLGDMVRRWFQQIRAEKNTAKRS
jgi:hypothetical protein